MAKETTQDATPFKLALDAINKSKVNVIRDETIREKDYPIFPVARMMAHYPDCVLFVNDLNVTSPGVTPRRHFEYLMHSVTQRHRFSKYEKPKNAEFAEFVMQMLNCSRDDAESYLLILSDDQLNEIKSLKKSWLDTSI